MAADEHSGSLTPQDIDEINRLSAYGLPMSVVLDILHGKLDEKFEVEQWRLSREAEAWSKSKANRQLVLEPLWDLDPSHYYLALDGASPDEFQSDSLFPMDADIDDVLPKLTFVATRAKDPWSAKYKDRTAGIAYRWFKGLSLTPPLIAPSEHEIIICGGMHRFHLARHYGAKRMPFLVRCSEQEELCKLLPTACAHAAAEHE